MSANGDGLKIFDSSLNEALLVVVSTVLGTVFIAEEDLHAREAIRETPERSFDERFDLRLPTSIRESVAACLNLNVHDSFQPSYFETGQGGFGVSDFTAAGLCDSRNTDKSISSGCLMARSDLRRALLRLRTYHKAEVCIRRADSVNACGVPLRAVADRPGVFKTNTDCGWIATIPVGLEC